MDHAKHYIELEVKQTERRNHAKDIAHGLSKDDYDGIVSVSGDGLLHEIINGVMSREDRDEFMQKVAIGVVPAGTSNGLFVSMMHHLEETGDPVHTAAFLICKGRRQSIDITELDLEY